MTDPTEIAIITSFCVALGVFATTAVLRRSLAKPEPHEEAPADAEESLQELLPETSDLPESPRENVPTWFYRPLDLLAIGFVFLLYFAQGLATARATVESDAVLESGGLIISIAFQFISAAIVTSFVITRIGPVEWLGLRWKKWPWVFVIAPASVIGMWMFFACLQVSGFMDWIESIGAAPVQETVKLLRESSDPLTLGLMAVAAVIAAPICEETIFRGYLYPAAKRFVGPEVACICSALVFSAAHGSLVALLPLFVFGCLLVYLYEKTGSIWAPIAVHLFFNGATVLIQMLARFYQLPLEPSL